MTKKAKRKPRRKSQLTPEQKAEALATVESGDLTLEQVAASLDVSLRTMQRWRKALQSGEGVTRLDAAERRRLQQLERENRELKLQLEIQKKFEAFSRKHQR